MSVGSVTTEPQDKNQKDTNRNPGLLQIPEGENPDEWESYYSYTEVWEYYSEDDAPPRPEHINDTNDDSQQTTSISKADSTHFYSDPGKPSNLSDDSSDSDLSSRYSSSSNSSCSSISSKTSSVSSISSKSDAKEKDEVLQNREETFQNENNISASITTTSQPPPHAPPGLPPPPLTPPVPPKDYTPIQPVPGSKARRVTPPSPPPSFVPPPPDQPMSKISPPSPPPSSAPAPPPQNPSLPPSPLVDSSKGKGNTSNDNNYYDESEDADDEDEGIAEEISKLSAIVDSAPCPMLSDSSSYDDEPQKNSNSSKNNSSSTMSSSVSDVSLSDYSDSTVSDTDPRELEANIIHKIAEEKEKDKSKEKPTAAEMPPTQDPLPKTVQQSNSTAYLPQSVPMHMMPGEAPRSFLEPIPENDQMPPPASSGAPGPTVGFMMGRRRTSSIDDGDDESDRTAPLMSLPPSFRQSMDRIPVTVPPPPVFDESSISESDSDGGDEESSSTSSTN